MYYKILTHLITIVHIIVTLFFLVAPFTNNDTFILLHIICVPALLIHWLANNNVCFLTTVEKYFRNKYLNKGEEKVDCFTCRLIEPVYDLNKHMEGYTTFVYYLMMTLWLISIFKLMNKYSWKKIWRLIINRTSHGSSESLSSQ